METTTTSITTIMHPRSGGEGGCEDDTRQGKDIRVLSSFDCEREASAVSCNDLECCRGILSTEDRILGAAVPTAVVVAVVQQQLLWYRRTDSIRSHSEMPTWYVRVYTRYSSVNTSVTLHLQQWCDRVDREIQHKPRP